MNLKYALTPSTAHNSQCRSDLELWKHILLHCLWDLDDFRLYGPFVGISWTLLWGPLTIKQVLRNYSSLNLETMHLQQRLLLLLLLLTVSYAIGQGIL